MKIYICKRIFFFNVKILLFTHINFRPMKNPFIGKAILYTMDRTRGERGVCATPRWSFSEFLPGRLTISTFQ